ncbi:hypothetical protein [Trichormus variabilis]|uniref:Peptidase S1 domain-containing protein n=1 Tax=Trichormus variabilis SAG 1403-4b TaxID=447716 RepID=A0A433UFD2_ANAVA|nr:hypothetical protein [Trichormus variabilis]MBD2628479.1 hypothetical protein [Trichormus variabilis FACHB-164]RUS92517.1 hypothetical protein DSM107003_50000 [Trichormus variabilis SAG 1403-4b]
MDIIYNADSDKSISGKYLNPEGWWDIEVQPIYRRVSGGSTSSITDKDLSITRYIEAQIATDLQINEIVYFRQISPVLNYSIPAGSQFVQEDNVFKTQTDGATKTITISSTIPSRTIDITLVGTIKQEPSTDIFNDYVSGSLSKHCSDAVDSRVIGKSNTTAWNLYATQSHTSSTYLRNTNFWCADLVNKLTCISPWNSQSGAALGITLITPRHFIACGHGGNYATGTTVRFVASDNTVVARTVIASKIHPQYSIDSADITICCLSSELPSDIVPCKLLPSNINSYLPNLSALYLIPSLCLDAQEKGLILDLYTLSTQALFRFSTKRNNFTETIIGGDSGNPQFLIINNQLVLIGVWSTSAGSTAQSTNLSQQLSAINQLILDVDALAGISTGYQVSTVDLSEFPTY